MTAPRYIPPSGALFVAAHHPAEEGDAPPYFRRNFTVGAGLRSATLRVTALGIVRPSLNGVRVGKDVLAPGWTSYRHRLALSTYDVAGYLVEGENAFGAIVAEGWAVGRVGFEHKRHHYADRPALFTELTLEYDDHTETVVSDENFRVGRGGVLAASIYDGETFDAGREPTGWDTPTFDDSSWTPALAQEVDLSVLTLDGPPPIRRTQELPVASITTSGSGRTIVDFGQVITGWVRLRVAGAAGQTITLRHAELLDAAGEPEYETLRTAKATDVYITRGADVELWEPEYTFHGFRYVEVDGWPGEIHLDDLTAVVVHSEMARTGWLETSDPLLSRLHENVVWTMRGNFVGVPTDCPQRDERLGWTGDLHAFAPTAAFLYDVREMLGSWLQDVAAEQAEKGYVPWYVPDISGTPSAPTALWSDVIVGLPWALYWEYGDAEILRRNWPAMTAFTTQVEGLLEPNGLWGSGFQFGDWLDPDAPADDASGGKTDRHLVATACFARTARQMAETAAVLGDTLAEKHYESLGRRVRDAFLHEYVAPSGRMVSDSATAYALAICFDLLDADRRREAGKRLAQLVAKSGYTVSTGFVGTPLVAQALSKTGHTDIAYLLLTEQECPSFLYPVTQGATTIWERWDAVRPDGSLNSTGMTSLSHYALGSVATWMHQVIGGLQALGPGYRSIRVAPVPGAGLTSARLVHDTIRGRIDVSWRIEAGEASVHVTVPPEVSAEVVLPLHPDGTRVSVGEGSHSWTYPVAVANNIEYTFDTPLQVLAEDRAAWRILTRVFKKHLPFPIDASGPEAAHITLGIIIPLIPHSTPELESDLREALASM